MRRLLPAVLLPALLLGCAQDAPAERPTGLAAPASKQDDPAQASVEAPTLQQVVAGDWRSHDNRERDAFRNPVRTLEFFGVQPTHSVVEITPGGGWYAEILAPYLYHHGRYVAAVVDPDALPEGGGRDYQQRARDQLETLFAGAPKQFDRAGVVAYDPSAPVFGAPESADVVLTFRNVHNWLSNDQAEAMFEGFFEVLRPGGVLGVVEHRANARATRDSGYVPQARVVELAGEAGFVLEEASEVNANPKDTGNHPNGVWTLPPGNNHDQADAERYAAIGESDRMTLRFRKPAD
ncbi:methyltransferase [Lysobacter sp. GX 14042]|uniref:class I SAM-dependent methyltransferase n=1 Tax=Lysobacter sp. GX 14042 TaxID=2907155 RepID=UPI001F3E7E2E|nr:methyltransferase [Lysobacter sp. GX 14042]MCE7032369.1 methyltransferase [Lysobacter sp. GX 14042]